MKLAGGDHGIGQGTSWAARAVVVTTIVEELPGVGFGLKLAKVAVGNPATLKLKLSVKPGLRETIKM